VAITFSRSHKPVALLRTRRAPLVAGLTLGALSLAVYQRTGYSVWMLLIWLASLVALGVYSWRESGALPRISRGDLLAGVAVLVIFAPLYLARLYDWPVQISSDESTIMDVSADLSSKDGVDPFSVSFYANRQTILFVVWGHLGKLLGGIDLAHMRLLHALVGLITIAASYYLFRQLLPRGWAMFASAVFGLNHAYLMISRLAMRENTAVLAEVVALGLLLRGFRQRHLFLTFLGGIAAGLGFYAYHPGRAAFVLWAVFLGLLALFYRRTFPLRRIATFGAAALAVLVIVAGPLLIAEGKAPPAPPQVDPAAQLLITKAGRQHQMDWVGASSIRDGYLTNVRFGLKTFNDKITDHGYIYVNQGHGFVDPLTGILVWVGAGVLLLALILQRRREEPWPLLMLSSFIVLWLGSAFIVNKAPNYTRLLITLPFAAYLVTVAVRFVAKQAERLLARAGRRLDPAPTIAIASAVLVAIGALNLAIAWDYVDRGRTNGDPIGSTARYMGDHPGEQFYLVAEENGPYPYFSWGNPGWWQDWLARVSPNTKLEEIVPSTAVTGLQPPAPFTLLMSRSALSALGAGLADRFPNGRVRNVVPDGTLVAFEVEDERAVSR
jgi:4-amino-4-deoxy-L-arabinose transferase-like glycosyltransferase